MHIDGIQELNTIDGYCIKLVESDLRDDLTIFNYDYIKNI